jgi:thiol-disulfide isomerase/thioredoxin
MKRNLLRIIPSVAFVLLAAVFVRAGELKIGDAAPNFSGIVGTDDKEHALKDYKSAKLLVLVFTCNHCPVAQAYEERLVKLSKDYKEKGVRIVAVNVNNLDADKLDKMKERAKAKKFDFAYIYDSSQKIGKDFGAKVTPHVFVLNIDRKLAYAGAIDDSMDAKKVKKHHLRDALDALLAGKEPPDKITKQFGCSIKYE